jgi:hypothetical protein
MLSMSLREVNIIQRKNYVAFSLKVVFLNMLPNHRDLRPLWRNKCRNKNLDIKSNWMHFIWLRIYSICLPFSICVCVQDFREHIYILHIIRFDLGQVGDDLTCYLLGEIWPVFDLSLKFTFDIWTCNNILQSYVRQIKIRFVAFYFLLIH